MNFQELTSEYIGEELKVSLTSYTNLLGQLDYTFQVRKIFINADNQETYTKQGITFSTEGAIELVDFNNTVAAEEGVLTKDIKKILNSFIIFSPGNRSIAICRMKDFAFGNVFILTVAEWQAMISTLLKFKQFLP